ncbi:hypothetical protein J4E91_005264 [Alternaria rosae]|nr:hypothetical protein J4E91_005264 [Alternaria rosae]
MSSTRDIAESERTAPLQRMTFRQRRWHFYDLVQKDTYEKGMIINYPSMNICQANDPNAVQTQFGTVCFKTGYAIVIENENKLEVLQLGTAGRRGPLAKSTAIRVDCFGMKKEGDDKYYCWNETLKRNVAVTPGKGVYNVAKDCPCQPVAGSFGNILGVIRLPRDSRIQTYGMIDEQALNSILQKRARRLLRKLILTMPPEMWIELVQTRLDNDKEAPQMRKDRLGSEQTKREQHHRNQPHQYPKTGQAQVHFSQ